METATFRRDDSGDQTDAVIAAVGSLETPGADIAVTIAEIYEGAV